jgi:hypothetical protein
MMPNLTTVSRRQFICAIPAAASIAVAPAIALANPANSAYLLGLHLGHQAKQAMGVSGPFDLVYFDYSAPHAAEFKHGLLTALEQTDTLATTGTIQWHGTASPSDSTIGFAKVAARHSKQMAAIDITASAVQDHAYGTHVFDLQASGACRVSVYA